MRGSVHPSLQQLIKLSRKTEMSSHHTSHSVQVWTMSFKITHQYLSHLGVRLCGRMQAATRWLPPNQTRASPGLEVSGAWLSPDPKPQHRGCNCKPSAGLCRCSRAPAVRARERPCPPKAIPAAVATREKGLSRRDYQLNTAPFRFGCSMFSINLIQAVYILLLPVPEITALGTAPYRYC